MSWKVFCTRRIPEKAATHLRDNGLTVEVYENEDAIPADLLALKMQSCDALICLLSDTISAEMIRLANNLKIVANYAVGYNNIDIKAATEKNIVVTNTPGVLSETTADLAWALLMTAARRIVEGDRLMRSGKFTGWGPLLLLGADIFGKTLGIVGAGRIGEAVVRRSKGFSMPILYYSRNKNSFLEGEFNAKKCAIDYLCREADFISLHVPLSEQTRHLIDRRRLDIMKTSAILVNTSRGPVVDEMALVQALREKKIAAAGLDVFENEPELTPGLTDLMNVVLAPHIGSASLETRTKMAEIVAENILALYKGKRPSNMINQEVFNNLSL